MVQALPRSQEIKTYLQLVNQDLAEDLWHITCTRLAPNAPEQNPVSDIWLYHFGAIDFGGFDSESFTSS